MSELFFAAKMVFLTFVIVMLMQIQVGTQTLEQKTLGWIRTSSFVEQLQEVADGGIMALRQMFSFITKNMNADFLRSFDKENQAGYRHLKAGIARSKEFIEEKTTEAKKKIKEKTKEQIDEYNNIEIESSRTEND